MKKHSIKFNIILNTSYEVFIMLTPFITAPYLSRVLGPTGIGLYSYTYTLQAFFSIFAVLGTSTYGIRKIARHRDDPGYVSKLFLEIQALRFVITMICLVPWIGLVILYSEYSAYLLWLTLFLVGTTFDISWYFKGMELFKVIVLRDTIFKLLNIACLFLFVTTSEDTAIYIAILSVSNFLGHLSLWPSITKQIKKVNLKSLKIWPHFKDTLVYFVPAVSITIYTVLDKTMIGIISNNLAENGYYEQATKIVNIAKTLTFTALNTVMGSRISYLFKNGNLDEIRQKIDISLSYILFMGIGICFGLIAVSKWLIPWFFGPGYDAVVLLLMVFSPIIIVIGISNCLDSMYYTPAGLRKTSNYILLIGAATNFTLNLLLIPRFGSMGAAIASVFAETLILVLYLFKCSHQITPRMLVHHSWKRTIAGALMFAFIVLIGNGKEASMSLILTQVSIGILIYAVTLLMMKDSFLMNIVIQNITPRLKFRSK